MNYIYDILLNFKRDFFEFFEWNLNDDIVHIRKIPIFRIEKSRLYDFKTRTLKINTELLSDIFNKTEIFKGKSKRNIKYSILLGCEDDVCAFVFDESGKIIGKSDLLLDEYEEILEIINNLDINNINYEILSDCKLNFQTRNEKEKINYIIKHIYRTSNEKLKYLYFDCFNIKEQDISKIRNKIINSIKEDSCIVDKIYKFYKLLSYNAR